MEILGVKKFKTTADGQFISVTFEMADAAPLEMQVTTEALSAIIRQLAGVVWDAQKNSPATRPRSIPLPVSAQAQPVKEQRGVVVRFAMDNHLEYLFALNELQAKSFGDAVLSSLAASPAKK